MAMPSHRRLRAAVAVGMAALLVGCTAAATDSSAAAPSPAPPNPAGGTHDAPVRVLQLNLCNSGIAACYTGRAVAEAAEEIRAVPPDVITLNEVCRDDVATLRRALADAVDGGEVGSAFQAARHGRTGDPYRCRNGRHYGIGIVTHSPSVSGSSPSRGIYPVQDTEDPEQRAWLCLDLATAPATTPAATICTTHLAYTEREIATAQCRHLFDTVIADLRTREGATPLVLGGDLNLGAGDDPDLRACLPPGFELVHDGGQQHVIATPEFVAGDSRAIDLGGATDHPGLLVTLVPRSRR